MQKFQHSAFIWGRYISLILNSIFFFWRPELLFGWTKKDRKYKASSRTEERKSHI